MTESCDDDLPNLVLDVLTTPASTADVSVTRTILQRLDAQNLPPGEFLVDQGYVDAKLLVDSQERGMDLIAPVRAGASWQDRMNDAQVLKTDAFKIHWDEQYVICPQGKRSWQWHETSSVNRETVAVAFNPKDCGI